jgi:hypothetical protein
VADRNLHHRGREDVSLARAQALALDAIAGAGGGYGKGGGAPISTYWEKLRDPRWQKRRLEVMSAAGFKCHQCSDSSTTLNVHHKIYHKGHAPWEYEDKELVCLCEPCHEGWHMLKGHANKLFVDLDDDGLRAMVGYGIAIALVTGKATKCQLGSSAAVRAFAQRFGLTEKQVVSLRNDDLWIDIKDIRTFIAKKRRR